MRGSRPAGALAIAAALGTGCPSVGAFECIENGDCDRRADGVCISNACAYPSNECDSGLAWSPNAAADPGACVDVPGEATGTTMLPTTTSPSSTSASATASTTATDATSTDAPSTTTSGPIPTCGSRKVIELDTELISPTTALVDYPLLLRSADDDFVDADPDTFFFTDAEGNPLAHDLEAFDAATGTLLAWVRLPEWTVGEPLAITLAWGDPGSVPDVSAGDVWAPTFLGVWHLDDELDDSEGEVVRNAVPGAGHAFAMGGMGSDQAVSGAIGGGIAFDGDDDSIEVPASFVGSLQSFTVSYWSRWDGEPEQGGGWFSRLNGEYLMPRCWRVPTSSNPACQLHVGRNTVGVGGDVEDIAPGEIVHMAFTWDGTVATTYYAGEVGRTNDDSPGDMVGGSYTFMIGREVEFGTFDGMIDEFRVSDRALPQEWIEADFRTQSNPGNAILDVGPTEPRPCE